MPSKVQITKIHTLKSALGLDEETYRAILAGYGVKSSTKLSFAKADQLIADLETKAVAIGRWEKRSAPRRAGNRPKNIDRGGSRADQLGKIEALLTVGKRPWSYADALAEKICRTPEGVPIKRVAFVSTDQLYKIITALRKQAQREGWDLSGEKR